jgi:hypothetical protein
VYRLVRALPREGIEGYLLSATNFRTVDVVDQLERDLGVPVVSCNQSIIWWITGLSGSLVRSPASAAFSWAPDAGPVRAVRLRTGRPAAWAQPSPSVLARADEVIQ